MLLEFTFRNFKSFKNEATLSLLSEKDDSNSFRTYYGKGKEISVLPALAIYGANAAGKSGFIHALYLMKHIVNYNLNVPGVHKMSYDPFLLDKDINKNEPILFEVDIILNDSRYQYGFEFNQDLIISEWLYEFSGVSKPKTWFTMNWLADEGRYEFNDQNIKNDRAHIQRVINERKDVLYLAVAGINYSHKICRVIYDWFHTKLSVVLSGSYGVIPMYNPAFAAELYLKNEDAAEMILNFMQAADFPINKIQIQEERSSEANLQKLKNIHGVLRRENLTHSYQIQLDHNGVMLDFNKESDGTKKMFCLAAWWYHALTEGYTLVIDELHTSLHPDLVKLLVSYFSNNKVNTKNAQLVFTSHDTSIMHAEYLSREQIWFCVKNKDDHSSEMYSLLDFGVRSDKENFENQYRQGRYGAKPLIRGI